MERNIYKIGKELFITSNEEIKEGDWYYDTKDLESLVPIYQRSQNLKFYSGCKKIILTDNGDLIKDGVQSIDDEFLEWFIKNPGCEFVETRYSYPTIDDEGDGSISEGYWLLVIPEENKIYRECPNGCRGKLSYLTKDECLCSCGTKWNIKTNKIIIPKEELKQESLEGAALKYASEKLDRLIIPYKELNANVAEYVGFINGAKWQQERGYSEEEVFTVQQISDLFIPIGKGGYIDNYLDYRLFSKEQPKLNFKEWFEQFSKLKNG